MWLAMAYEGNDHDRKVLYAICVNTKYEDDRKVEIQLKTSA